MASDAPDTDELPSVDDQLLQAINILKVCSAHTDDDGEEFDLSYPLWAVVSLLEEFEFNGEQCSKIIKASSIVKAVAVTITTTDQAIGTGGFEPSWLLEVAVDLVDEVIREIRAKKGKKRSRSKKAMREISTVDPDCAREFHRLLVTAARLPLAALQRIARYAEIELADEKPRRGVRATAKPANATEPAPELRP